MVILPIEYGKSTLPESMIFKNGDANKRRKIVFKVYLIKTAEKLILVDAGCDTMPGFVMEDFRGPVKALEKENVSPEDISDVIITHSHHDHIEGVKHFHKATIHIQRDEAREGKKYIPDEYKINLFDEELKLCPFVRAIKIGGHSVGSCIVEVTAEDKTYIISGDECYLRECLENKVPTGCSFNPEKSKGFIEEYSKDCYTVLLCHDE